MGDDEMPVDAWCYIRNGERIWETAPLTTNRATPGARYVLRSVHNALVAENTRLRERNAKLEDALTHIEFYAHEQRRGPFDIALDALEAPRHEIDALRAKRYAERVQDAANHISDFLIANADALQEEHDRRHREKGDLVPDIWTNDALTAGDAGEKAP